MPISTGLEVDDVVSASVFLSPVAAQTRNFGSFLIIGDSDVIDVNQRLRQYASSAGVAADFGSAAPEFTAAVEFFGQTPQPSLCYVGRWARTATHGTLVGSTLSVAQQAITNFSNITNGGINLVVDGSPHNLSGISFSGLTNLNGIAAALATALSGVATVIWDSVNQRFVIKSATNGIGSAVLAATPGSGTDLSLIMGLGTNSNYSVAGISAETPLQALSILEGQSNAWYGATFSASTQPADADYVACSAFIQSALPARTFGITTQESVLLSGGTNTGIANEISNNRTFVQYSSTSPVAAAAAFGIAFTTNFQGANSLYTLKFKQESGITPETLTETQYAALKAMDCNAFVNYNNGVAILQEGVMSDGTFFDVIHGTDWLQNDLQTAVFNAFLTNRKIAQTDSGVNQLVTVVSNELTQAVTNGLVAPGVWNGPSVGAIVTGQTLPAGFYVYAPQIASQSTAARAARQAPVLTICIKLAGAIHSASLIVNVNQ